MATTLYSAIRATQISTIEALTPTSQSAVPFRHSREEKPLLLWAQDNAEAAFRRFSLLDSNEYQAPEVSNCDQEYVRTTARLQLCYPKTYGKYGVLNESSMRALIEEDAVKIDTAIGHRSQTTPADWLCQRRGEPDLSDEGQVFALTMLYEVGFYRAF